MTGSPQPFKQGVLTARDVTHLRQIPENGALLAGAIASGRTKTNIGFVISAGSAASNLTNITINFLDHNGKPIREKRVYTVMLANADGTISGTAPSGAVSSTTGAQVVALVSKTLRMVQTDDNGVHSFSITDTSKTLYRIGVIDPVSGLMVLSRQLVTDDYG